MAQEITQNTAQSGGMEKDLDDRLLANNQYRDLLNGNIGRSEGANVGVIENVRGNEIIPGQENLIDGEVIGVHRDQSNGTIYWFVAGDNQDAIYEFNQESNTVSTILVDSTVFVPEGEEDVVGGFAFNNAGIAFNVSDAGLVSLTISSGTITSSTFADGDQLGAVAVPTLRTNVITVRVPAGQGFPNENASVTGSLFATQQATGAFQFSDAGVLFSVNSSGLVSLSAGVGTITASTHANGDTLDTVDTPTTILNEITITVPNDPDLYSNAGETVMGTVSAIQPALATFLFADAGIQFSVSTQGIVSLTIAQGTIASSTFTNGQDLGVVSVATDRVNTIVVNVPNDPAIWFNAGEQVTDTLTYEQEPVGAFQFDDAGISFSVSQSGTVSLSITEGTIESATFTDAQELGTVAVNTTRTNTIGVRVPNLPSTYTNANEIITGTATAVQAATQASGVTFDDTGVTCSVDSSGNINLDSSFGTPTLASGQVTSYPTVTSSTVRNISVRVTGTTPTGFTGAGQPFDVTGICTATQAAFSIPTFAFGNAGVSCSVNGQDGSVSASTSVGSVASFSPTSFSTVSVATSRTISVRITGTVPQGYTNSGNSFDFTGNCVTTQPAVVIGAFTEGDWSGSVSVSALGQVLADNGNVGSVTTNPSSFAANTTDNDIARTMTVTLQNIPSGFSNSGGNISFSRTVQQPSNLPIFEAADWSGVVSVTQSGTVTASAGNGSPITIITTSVPANTGADDITVQITVEVTIPSGFRFFGSTKEIVRGATQPGVGTPEFSNFVTITDQVTGATVNSTSVTLTAEAQGSDFTDISVTPNNGFEFTSVNNISVSSTNTTLASGIVTGFDGFGLGQLLIRVSGTIGNSNQNVTLTVTGAAVATSPPFAAGSITSNTGSSQLTGSGTFTVTHSNADGAVSVAWSVSGSGLSLGASTTETVSWQVTGSGGGSVRADLTDSSGATDFATFTYSSLGGVP